MPSLSDKQLEERLTTAGKTLAHPPSSLDQLLPLLDVSYLRPPMLIALQIFAFSISSSTLISHGIITIFIHCSANYFVIDVLIC